MKYNTVVFDIDGTLVDTIEEGIAALKRAVPSPPYPSLQKKDIDKFKYMSNIDFFSSLKWGNKDELYRKFFAYLKEELANADFFPGILETILEIKRSGLNLALVTSETRTEFEVIDKSLGLYNYFEYVVCFEDVKMPKPDPDPLYLVMNRFEVEKKDIVYVGDSLTDMDCARDAGVCGLLAAWGNQNQDIRDKFSEEIILRHPKELLDKLW